MLPRHHCVSVAPAIGGALRALAVIVCAAGPAAAQTPAPVPSAAPDSIADMRAALDSELAKFDTARARLVVVLRADSGTARADSVFVLFDSTSRRALYDLSPTAKRALNLLGGGPETGSLKPLQDAFLAHGIWLRFSEGEADESVSDSLLRAVAGRFLTQPMRAWLDIKTREQSEPTGGDAAIDIPLDEIGRRLAATDRVRAMAVHFAASKDLDWQRSFYLNAFLAGWDNTPAFRDGVMVPAMRASLERFAAAYPTTESGKLVGSYLRLLREAGWRRTPSVRAFLRSAISF